MSATEDAVMEVSRHQREFTPRPAVLAVPADTPAYSRDWLLSLDGAIASEARAHHGGDSDIARLVVGRLWHARADGDTAFFLHHWLRLFEAQAEARATGTPAPKQTWTQPDWAPERAA